MNAIAHPKEPTDAGRILSFTFTFAAYAALAGLFYAAMLVIRAHHGGLNPVLGATALFVVAITALSYAAMRSRLGAASLPTQAHQRYRKRQFVSMAVYGLMLFLALAAQFELWPSGPLAWIIAVLPALPLIAMVGAMGLYLREETDEFQRALMVEAALWATGVILCLSTAWGFLETMARAPHLASWLMFPIWSACFGLASIFVRRRFR